MSFDFSRFQYGPVILLPSSYEIYDFSRGYDSKRERSSLFGIGRYNEKRPGMYSTDLFISGEEPRDIHVGVDIAAPVGTSIHAFFDGVIYMTAINSAAGDYGGTVMTEHNLDGKTIWALHGHLSHASVRLRAAGERIQQGEVIGWVGDRAENGGWNPHLHFQLSWIRPEKCDLPGAVSEKKREEALRNFPDPRFVLGALY